MRSLRRIAICLHDEVRAFAFLATTMADGSPQVTPLWFDVEGELLRLNTARGRTKERNTRARPRVALAILDPANPYRYLQIRGTVIEHREQGAEEHIRQLSLKYRGTDEFPIPAGPGAGDALRPPGPRQRDGMSPDAEGLLHWLEGRRSVRRFEDRPVPRDAARADPALGLHGALGAQPPAMAFRRGVRRERYAGG